MVGRGSRLVAIGCCALSLQLAVSNLAAQQKPPSASVDANDAAAAKQHFELGVKLYKAKDFEAALLEFEQSYTLGKRPSALRNKAQTLRDLKRSAEAMAAYQMLLDVHDAELKPQEKIDTQRAIEELKTLTGEVVIGVDQPDAEVLVDGKLIGKSPLQPVRFNVGTHKVRVQKQGFDPIEKEFTAISQQKVVVLINLSAEVTTGHITVKEQNGAPGIHVFIDGKDVGTAPWEGDVAPGSHLVEAKSATLASDVRPVTVPLKGKIDVVLLATPLMGTVVVTVTPDDALITIDGVERGKGTFKGELSPGSHQLTVTRWGYANYQSAIVVERGKTTPQTIVMVEGKSDGAQPVYEGMFARLGFFGAFGLHSAANVECDAATTCNFTKTTPFGVGLDLRGGYSFGKFAIEGVGAGMIDVRSSKRQFPGTGNEPVQFDRVDDSFPREEAYGYLGIGGFLGAGGRYTTNGTFARFTAGAAIGGVYRAINVARETQGNSTINDTYRDFAKYLAPGLLLDSGVLLGSTPGTRFMLGLTAWIDFPNGDVATTDRGPRNAPYNPAAAGFSPGPATVPYDTPAFVVAKGPQFFIGPRLGLEFGH